MAQKYSEASALKTESREIKIFPCIDPLMIVSPRSAYEFITWQFPIEIVLIVQVKEESGKAADARIGRKRIINRTILFIMRELKAEYYSYPTS